MAASLLALPLISTSGARDDSIARCAKHASDAERIACLENAIRQIDNVTESILRDDRVFPDEAQGSLTRGVAEKAADDRVERQELESERFGLPTEPDAADAVTAIDVTIVATTQNAYGKSIYTTKNGQVWQQTDQKSLRIRQLPVAATIRSGTSGSFFLRAKEGGVAVRVKRRK